MCIRDRTFDPLTLNECIGCHVLKFCAKFERNRLKSAWVMATWGLSAILDFKVGGFQLLRGLWVSEANQHTKFEQNPTIHGWVIDHLVNFRTFSHPLLMSSQSWMGRPKWSLVKTSSNDCRFQSLFRTRCVASFWNYSASKSKMWPNFDIFGPCVKIRWGVGEVSDS